MNLKVAKKKDRKAVPLSWRKVKTDFYKGRVV